MVRECDHVVSSDLQYWLNYVELDASEFWKIANSFRDPRVWSIKNGNWWKDNIWGEKTSFGDVHLDSERINDFDRRQQAKVKIS